MTDSPGDHDTQPNPIHRQPDARDVGEGPPHLTGGGDGRGLLPWLLVVAAAALLGAIFAAVSASDFIQHLDRQVHSIHCSFIPGAGREIGESGCRAALMSPYSSLFRQALWGGIPIALWGLAVFAYLVFRALDFAMRPRVSRSDTAFLLLATLLPVGMSGIYGYFSVARVGEVCKLCAGMYAASGLACLGAIIAHVRAPRDESGVSPLRRYAAWFGVGVVFVGVLTLAYVGLAPRSDKSARGCGTLVKKDDPNGVLFGLGGAGVPGIAVVDPLCDACRGFDERLRASGLRERIELRGVLMPLDASCNWMVKESLHPGACAVSEAILCDRGNGARMLDWAFAHQKELLALARADEPALRRRLAEEFPSVKDCLGTPAIKNKLNKSLRWAVANALPVLTPQLFIGERRVCDEDTDLGLEYTVAEMLSPATAPAGGRR